MSKFLTKTVKKPSIITAILGVILAVAIVIAIVFGFNTSARIKDSKSVTISMSQYTYAVSADKVEKECEKVFKNLDVSYEIKGTMDGDESEIVYVFDKDTKDEVLTAAKVVLETVFATEAWEGSFITVSVTDEDVVSVSAEGYVLRAVIAVAVFVVLAFIYVAIRFNVKMGLITAIATVAGGALTTAFVILFRVPVTNSIAYVIAVGSMLSAVTTLLTMNKIRANNSEEVIDNVAWVEIGILTAVLGGALILMGILATETTRNFASAALIATLVADAIGELYAPAWYLAIKNCCKKSGKKGGYVGATSKKVKETEVEVEEVSVPVAPVQVAPTVEEKEEVVEETTEEVVEETTEEVVEEATEEVVEEATEEVVEETTEEVVEEATEEVVEEKEEANE